jgi:hypothetical protein
MSTVVLWILNEALPHEVIHLLIIVGEQSLFRYLLCEQYLCLRVIMIRSITYKFCIFMDSKVIQYGPHVRLGNSPSREQPARGACACRY